eukprot:gene24798-39106_t
MCDCMRNCSSAARGVFPTHGGPGLRVRILTGRRDSAPFMEAPPGAGRQLGYRAPSHLRPAELANKMAPQA